MDDKADRTAILESMPIKQAIWKLSIPTMAAMLIQVIYNMTDTFFIGKLNEPNMVAAITLCMPIVMGIQAFGNIFAIGGASLISRLLGAGERKGANHAAAISFWAALVICTITSIALFLYMEPVLSLCGASVDTMPYCKSYLSIMLIGGAFMGLQMTMGGLLRSEGATKESMVGMMSGSILNIILDPIFILLMNMGIAGAALATTIGNTVGFLYYIWFYLRKKGIISIAPRYFNFNRHYYADIFKIGIPASLGMVLMTVGLIISNVFAAGFSDTVVAANGVVFRLTNIATMLTMGMSQGCQPLMGYNFGCHKYDRLLSTIKYSIRYSTILCTVFAALFYIFARGWILVFITDENVVSTGVLIMRAMVVSMPFFGVQMILMIMFQSLGRSVESLIISLGRQGIFFIPALIIFSKVWGLTGFMYSMPFADILTTILSVILFFAMRKKLPRLSDEAPAIPQGGM
jgi:putative MATE family efflux protein